MSKKIDPLIDYVENINQKLDLMIALLCLNSELPKEKLIIMLSNSGYGYKKIKNLLGVSETTISKALKKK